MPDLAGVEVKPMFGNLGAFINRKMFMGLFGSDIGVKLPEEEREELLAEAGSGPFGPIERPMGGYVTLPGNWSADQAERWIQAAHRAVAALPAKTAKPPKAKGRPT
ncbi:MAG: TfoX/Sxy family protein [Ilumatobacteraceae bacterium]